MIIHVLFGTESGNAELVASDIADALQDEHDVRVDDLTDAADDIGSADLTLIVCSTHGEGDLPQSAVPFVDALRSDRPDLTGLTFAVFGLGDSSYPNYSKGSEHVEVLLRELGASRIGEYGRHDANGRSDPSDVGVEWARSVIETRALVDKHI
ncbi:flavodoxin domain-containing protein [Microbacterium foliorum]|uniref:flavodoxin domain-containing protein n=1 Tax=Microbacterium foliorum TaxID=104336 RepID=UPI0037365505